MNKKQKKKLKSLINILGFEFGLITGLNAPIGQPQGSLYNYNRVALLTINGYIVELYSYNTVDTVEHLRGIFLYGGIAIHTREHNANQYLFIKNNKIMGNIAI